MTVGGAVSALRRGDLVVFPTRGPYGIAALASHAEAVNAVFELKRRPTSVPLPIGVADLMQMETLVHVTPLARSLLLRLEPSDLTLILDPVEDARLAPVLLGERGLGVRVMGHPLARELASRAGPYTVTSANVHGRPASTDVEQARAQLGGVIAIYLDGGVGNDLASTVVDARGSEPIVIREGRLTKGSVLTE